MQEQDSVVIVCGGGAAGLATALSAARHGANVCLIECGPELGGTVAACHIHTLGGIFDRDGKLLNDGLAVELVERLKLADAATAMRRIGKCWVLAIDPDVYRSTVSAWIASTPRIRVLCSTQVRSVSMDGDRVATLDVAGTTMRARAVIDATGGAEIVRRIDADLVQADDTPAAAGWIARLRGVDPVAQRFPERLAPLRVIHDAARSGRLPESCVHAWLDAGTSADEIYVKLFVPIPANWRQQREKIQQQAEETQRAVFSLLKTLPEFARAEIWRNGQLGIRDGGRIVGEYMLSADDVRAGRQFPDAACNCGWPIEHWDSRTGLTLEYLPQDYQIPLRSLRVQGISNMFAAGKCLAADRWAQASARVVGSCWAMGEAVGRAAACT